jgi:hypothetical protein
VSIKALSKIHSSSAVIFQTIREIIQETLIIADLKISQTDHSESFIQAGKSNGLIFSFEFNQSEIYVHQTVSHKSLYSFSGSITITSDQNIINLNISNFTV